MSTGPLRQLHILKASASERSYAGRYGYEDLPRLKSYATVPDTQVEVELALSRDHRGHRVATVQINVRMSLQCQRCLETTLWSTQLKNQLMVVTDEAQEAAVEDRESLLLADGVLDVAELVEDEIMLALPLVPRHEDDSDCGRAWTERQAQRDEAASPFAALAALKSKH